MPMGRRPTQLTANEIKQALSGLPSPIGSPQQLADLIGIGRGTVYAWMADGRLDGAFRKRGKHALIWLPRAVELLFNGPEW